MKLEQIVNENQIIELNTLKDDEELLKEIQTKLSALHLYPSTMIDGLYGQRTETALFEFCDALDLDNMITGQFDPTFAQKLIDIKPGELVYSKKLSDADYKRAATLLGVEVAIIRAVVEVEAAGAGFLPDGRPKILFERHWFWKLTPLPVSRTRPDLSSPRSGGYLGGVREWDRLNAAIEFDRIPALKSASWGLGQVMGFNHKIVGYDDIEEFVRAMHQSEGKQIDAMMNFIKHNNLAPALRSHNWEAFARAYNGPAGIPVYPRKLAAAYRRHAA